MLSASHSQHKLFMRCRDHKAMSILAITWVAHKVSISVTTACNAQLHIQHMQLSLQMRLTLLGQTHAGCAWQASSAVLVA